MPILSQAVAVVLPAFAETLVKPAGINPRVATKPVAQEVDNSPAVVRASVRGPGLISAYWH